MLYQYGNPANPRAHYETTGPEIWSALPEVTHFVAGFGTSGTLLGVGRYLKEQNPDVQVWAVEPPAGESVDGLRSLDDGFIPPIFNDLGGEKLLDRKTVIGPRDSVVWTRRLAERGIFAGLSTGAAGSWRGEVRGIASFRGQSSCFLRTEDGSTCHLRFGRVLSTKPSRVSRTPSISESFTEGCRLRR